MLPTPTSAWHPHLLCPGSQTKSLAVAHSCRKRFWRRPCGSTASDVSYLDTRTRRDSQTGGTNGPQSPSQALRFPPWLLFNMLQVDILLCDMEDVYLFSGTWGGTSKPRLQFGYCFSLGLRIDWVWRGTMDG